MFCASKYANFCMESCVRPCVHACVHVSWWRGECVIAWACVYISLCVYVYRIG